MGRKSEFVHLIHLVIVSATKSSHNAVLEPLAYSMFNSLKNALGLGKAKDIDENASTRSPSSYLASKGGVSQLNKVSEWASMQGLSYTDRGGKSYTMEGKIGGKPWRLEQGKPSRDFIKGIELRARGEMGLNEDIAVMVMTRSLKNDLDKRAFSLYTDTLQTQVDPHLPEEMRWLSMYEEVGWEGLGQVFLDEYAILADDRDNAVSWLTAELAGRLLAWPSSEPDVPRVLMVLRGKVYLRMQINEGDIPTLEHATTVFTTACDAALAAFSADSGRYD